MGLSQTSAPSVEPLSLAAAKAHLRVTTSDENDLIQGLITVARRYCEEVTGRQFITATWQYLFEDFPSGNEFAVPWPPLQSVTSITYLDEDGASQTLSTDVYGLDTSPSPGRIYLKYNQSWPSYRSQRGGIVVRYVAGYGDAASDVPEPIVHAIKLHLGFEYAQRLPVAPATVGNVVTQHIPDRVWSLLAPYRMIDVSTNVF